MASVNKATILGQLQDTAARIKQYILQQISDLSDAVLEAIPETYAGSAEAGGAADKAVAIPYGHVDSTSTATVYTATIDGITELVDGTTVLLKNGVVTSKAGFTININGLGAKPVYNNMAAESAETTIFNVAYTLLLIYDSTRVSGGCWINYRGYYTDSNTVPTGYCTTAAGTAAKVATCNYGYRDDDAYFPCLFRYENTAANATLAISSYATTAAPIYVNGARTSSNNTFGRGVILFLYHDGAYYTYNDGRFPIVVDGAVTSVQEYVATKYTKPSAGIPASDLAAGVIPTVPSAATSAPLMDGTAAVGSSTKWAKEDHVHPSDTSKVDSSITMSGGVSAIENTDNTLSIGWYLESQQQDIYIEVNRALSKSNVVIHAEKGENSNELIVSPTGTTIHEVVAPTADGDAANKKYVDDAVATMTEQEVEDAFSIAWAGTAYELDSALYTEHGNIVSVTTDGTYGASAGIVTTAHEGDTVTVATGYHWLPEFKRKDNGAEIETTTVTTNVYSFIMPAANVLLYVRYDD